MNIKKNKNITRAMLILSIAFVLIYSTAYIQYNSYVVEGQRYYSLFDDAMISMRYAENIANGNGPVWNQNGEKVEGFSNPLWVYIMSAVHILQIPKPYTSLIMQILTVLLMILNIIVITRIAQIITNYDGLIVSFTMLLTATYLPLLNWSLQGLEVSLIVVLLNLSILFHLKYIYDNKQSLLIYFIPAIMILVRMDTILFILSAFIYFYLFEKSKFRIYFFKTILFTAITVIILLLWRNYYFGEFLPNTYYLKMTGYSIISRIGKGLYAYAKFLFYLTPIFFFLPLWFYFKTKKRIALFLVFPIAMMSLYSIYIGGDSWEWWMPSNRFLSATIPLFIIAVLISIKNLMQKYFVIVGIIFIITLNFNNWEYLKGELLLEKTFTEKDNRHHTELALEAKKIIKKDGTAAVTIAGTLPYFLERNCIDILGKNDKAVARMKVLNEIPFMEYTPGHIKWNYSYSIGKLKPDAVLQLWKKPQQAILYLADDYEACEIAGFNAFFRKNSPNINWGSLQLNY